MCFYGCKSLTINYHFSVFVGYRFSSNRDIIHLVCQVTSQDFVIEGPCSSFSGSSSLYAPEKFGSLDIVVVKASLETIDIVVLVRRVIPQALVIERSSYYID